MWQPPVLAALPKFVCFFPPQVSLTLRRIDAPATGATTLSIMTLKIMTLTENAGLSCDTQHNKNGHKVLCLYAKCCYAECTYAICSHAECHYAECHYAECHYAECHYAECHYAKCYAECHYAVSSC